MMTVMVIVMVMVVVMMASSSSIMLSSARSGGDRIINNHNSGMVSSAFPAILPNDNGFYLNDLLQKTLAKQVHTKKWLVPKQKSSYFYYDPHARLPLATCARADTGSPNLVDRFQCRGTIDDSTTRDVDARYTPNECQPLSSGSLNALQDQRRRDNERLGIFDNHLRTCWLTTPNGLDQNDPIIGNMQKLKYCAIPCGVQADCEKIDASSTCISMRFPSISGTLQNVAETRNVCVRCCCGATSATGANSGVVPGTCLILDSATTLNAFVSTYSNPLCCREYANSCL